MKRARFLEPPIVFESMAVDFRRQKTRQICNMLKCITVLRPDWVGSVLPIECFYHIGRMGSTDLKQYSMKKARKIRFNFDFITTEEFDMTDVKWTEFDSISTVAPFENDTRTYMRFSKSFCWWPSIVDGAVSDDTWKNYCTMVNHVIGLFPEGLVDDTGYSCGIHMGDYGDIGVAFDDKWTMKEVAIRLVNQEEFIDLSLWVGLET